MPESTVTVPRDAPSQRMIVGDESLTEDYGESAAVPPSSSGGNVDFFSSLGTEVKKKRNILDRPEPAAVRAHLSYRGAELISL